MNMEGVQSPPGPNARAPDEASRKEVLRKKGAEYFEQILAKASEDKDPSVASPGQLRGTSSGERLAGDRFVVLKRASSSRRTVDVERLDPDLETVRSALSLSLSLSLSLFLSLSLSLSLSLTHTHTHTHTLTHSHTHTHTLPPPPHTQTHLRLRSSQLRSRK